MTPFQQDIKSELETVIQKAIDSLGDSGDEIRTLLIPMKNNIPRLIDLAEGDNEKYLEIRRNMKAQLLQIAACTTSYAREIAMSTVTDVIMILFRAVGITLKTLVKNTEAESPDKKIIA